MRPTSAHLAAGADEDGVRRDRGVADVGGGAALDHLLEHLLTTGAAASGRDAWACMQQSASASRSASQQATEEA